ncbi:MAG: hypothetical protein ACLFP1_06120 [Candidatus Goldiibacteriota bacterium]
MKKKSNAGTKEKNTPINAIAGAVLVFFMIQAGLVFFYNNNNLTFPHIESFYSLEKASVIAESNFTSMKTDVPSKPEINGFLYPAAVSLIYKIFGKNNTVPVLYVLAFLAFLVSALAVYRISGETAGKKYELISVFVYISAAPVILGFFSGSDVMAAMVLMALNAYFVCCQTEKGRYKGALITAALMTAVNTASLIFGVCSLIYLALKFYRKKVKKYYAAAVPAVFTAAFLIFSFVLARLFIEKFTAGYMQAHTIFNTQTFYADTFFKDGFLWNRVLPPFLAVFFFIYVVVNAIKEFKTKNTGFIIYVLLMTMAALQMEFFSSIPLESKTVLFMPPFYAVMIPAGLGGIVYSAGLFKGRPSDVLNRNNIIYAFFVFMIFFNFMLYFVRTIEYNQLIKYTASDKRVVKFIER